MTPEVYYVYSKASRQNVTPAAFDFILAGMQRAGAIVMEEEQFALFAFRDHGVKPVDKFVGFFVSDVNAELLYSAVRPENRWMHLIDVRVTPDGRAYTGRIEYGKRLSITHAVVTCENADYSKQLLEAGIGYLVMPFCVPRRRPRTNKSNVVSMAGTFEEPMYPARVRVKKLLEPTYPLIVNPAPVKGEAYYDVLDNFQFGVTCRGGYRDAFVAKYVEFGMCHVLPIGDCPSYMPDEMKRLLVNVEGRSDEWVTGEVARLLRSPDELFARQEAYCEATHRHFDLLTNAKRVVQTIRDVA